MNAEKVVSVIADLYLASPHNAGETKEQFTARLAACYRDRQRSPWQGVRLGCEPYWNKIMDAYESAYAPVHTQEQRDCSHARIVASLSWAFGVPPSQIESMLLAR